jgi:hypothetical protein
VPAAACFAGNILTPPHAEKPRPEEDSGREEEADPPNRGLDRVVHFNRGRCLVECTHCEHLGLPKGVPVKYISQVCLHGIF